MAEKYTIRLKVTVEAYADLGVNEYTQRWECGKLLDRVNEALPFLTLSKTAVEEITYEQQGTGASQCQN